MNYNKIFKKVAANYSADNSASNQGGYDMSNQTGYNWESGSAEGPNQGFVQGLSNPISKYYNTLRSNPKAQASILGGVSGAGWGAKFGNPASYERPRALGVQDAKNVWNYIRGR